MTDPKEQVVSEALCRNHLSGFAEVCAGVCGDSTVPGQPHPCEHALTVWRSDAQEILRALASRVDPQAMEAARRIMERAERIESNKRPTVAELEAILAQADSPPVHINPDGSIGAGENDALTVARALLAGEGNSVAAGASPLGLLPCPFCGDDAYVDGNEETKFFVGCKGCYCNVGEAYDRSAMPEHMFMSAEEAVSAWNRRAGKDASGEKAGLTQAARALSIPP